MPGWQHDRCVEERADAILASVLAAGAYARHFETQMRAARFRAWRSASLTALLGTLRQPDVVLVLALVGLFVALGLAFSWPHMSSGGAG